MKHKIKIYWCDDEFASKVLNPINEDYLKENGIEVQSFFKSDDLLVALNKPNIENHVDVVIFDFNMSNVSDGRPDIEEKSGFLEILRIVPKYTAKGITFYLWSKMDIDFIRGAIAKSSDYKKELAIFDNYINENGHKRWFAGDEFEELIDSVALEVEQIETPQTVLRRKYPEAYEAALWVDDKCWDKIINILTLTPESSDWNKMEDLINPLRCEVDLVMAKLGLPFLDRNDENKPGLKLSTLARFLKGEHNKLSLHYALRNQSLATGIEIMLRFVNDGSHCDPTLQDNIRKYITQTKDIHLLRFLAHGLINILVWAKKANEFRKQGNKIYFLKSTTSTKPKPGAGNTPFSDLLKDVRIDNAPTNENNDDPEQQNSTVSTTIQGTLECDSNGYLHIDNCQVTNLQIGKDMRIVKIVPNNSKDKSGYDYFSSLATPVEE